MTSARHFLGSPVERNRSGGKSFVALSKRCEQEVLPDDRWRGEALFEQGLVRVLEAEALEVLALVTAGADYLVSIDGTAARDQGVLHVGCSCQGLDDGFLCEHLWAAVLAVDAGTSIMRIPGTDPLVCYGGESFSDEEFFSVVDTDTLPQQGFRLSWRQRLGAASANAAARRERLSSSGKRSEQEILYHLDLERTRRRGMPVVGLFARRRKKNGEWGKPRSVDLSDPDRVLAALPESGDRELIQLLSGVSPKDLYAAITPSYDRASAVIPPPLYELVLPRLCGTGRLLADSPQGRGVPRTLRWDHGAPWTLKLAARWAEGKKELSLTGVLARGGEKRALSEPEIVLESGLVVFDESLARFDPGPYFPWVQEFRLEPAIGIPASDASELVEALWSSVGIPPCELPPDLALEEKHGVPVPTVRFRSFGGVRRRLGVDVVFDYDGELVPLEDPRSGLVKRGTVRVRDRGWETRHLDRLFELGMKERKEPSPAGTLTLAVKDMPEVSARLLEEGWVVTAEGVRVRRPGAASFRVESGIDWLDLEGGVDFDGEVVTVPAILRCLRRGERFIRLSDGSQGMLPKEWLERSGALAELEPRPGGGGDALRFHRTQVLLLDALLAEAREVRFDRGFERLRERLRSFRGIEPMAEPRGFRGTLRPYQREGLAWLCFLAELGFGGCLADDMGLGKTIQVLALLQVRKLRRREKKTTLIVVPRSLVHNWMEEAQRFVPRLKTIDYSGPARAARRDELSNADVVFTTYGVLRRDILVLEAVHFDTVILDEAQAIKNHNSQSAKSCRLLRADHRLALTGTPVENHLGELWSIFQFLNPGMLGRLGRMTRSSRSEPSTIAGDAATLGRALRPFILRRTKSQVLPDLPPKSEQTVFCSLERSQRKLYEELRRYYQRSLSEHIGKVGLGRAKIRVLEALLRLRQAACHPGLLDPDRVDEKAAKIDVLLEQVSQVVEEGHKALVFSQFTRLLAIVRRRLEERGFVYEYLDGRTKDRKKRVDRFQSDPACPLFLVSLKAGGLGLNLTAADYVFLLDPWWNPATESQAIDRAHRIGQTRSVFAYRLIAENTVEDKILQMQETKREIAAAVVSEDNSLVKNLTAEDLELLLS